MSATVCAYCGLSDGHTHHCSVTVLGLDEMRAPAKALASFTGRVDYIDSTDEWRVAVSIDGRSAYTVSRPALLDTLQIAMTHVHEAGRLGLLDKPLVRRDPA